jgi:hypothetical protein
MFVFDNGIDSDLSNYIYEVYLQSQVTGTSSNYVITGVPVSTGYATANVFTVAVENSSTDPTTGALIPKRYYGRLKAADTSANYSEWTNLALSEQDTPLIESQFINSLTASKITAGTIGAHQIILSQAGPVTEYTDIASQAIIRSSDYSTEPQTGWIIKGNGDAEFGNLKISGKSNNKILLQTSPINGDDLISIVEGNMGPSWSTAYTSFYADAKGKFSLNNKLSYDPNAGLSVTGEIQADRGWIGGNNGWLFGNDGVLVSGSGYNTIGLASGDSNITGAILQTDIVSITVDDEANIYNQTTAPFFSTLYIKLNRQQLPAEIQANVTLLQNTLITLSGFSSPLNILNNKRFTVQSVELYDYTIFEGDAFKSSTLLPGDRIIITVYGEDQNLDQIHTSALENLYVFNNTAPNQFPIISFYDTVTSVGSFYRMWSGDENPENAPFSLDAEGNLKVNTISVGSAGSSGGIISVGGSYNGAPNPGSIWLSNGSEPPAGTGAIGDIWIAY